MKYYQSSKFPKFIGSTGFYTIIVCCLIALGAASWFAVSKYNSTEISKAEGSSDKSSSSLSIPSYSTDDKAYNDITEAPESIISDITSKITESVAGEISDIPYSSEETSSAETRSFILPVDGNISKGFSNTALQYSATYGDMRMHTGIDIICEKGSDIKSAGDGTVTAYEESSTLGKVITIDHGDGIIVKYCGLESINVVTKDKVSAGSIIGTSGSVPGECADQSHIHIEAYKDGIVISPLSALNLE